MESPINERLDLFLKEKKMTRVRLGELLVGKSRSNIGHWISGRQEIPDEIIVAIMRIAPELNANWFLHGFGKMINSPEEMITKFFQAEDQQSPYICQNPLCIQEKKFMKEIISDRDRIIEMLSDRKVGNDSGSIKGGMEKH